jgi:hypothetical protein
MPQSRVAQDQQISNWEKRLESQKAAIQDLRETVIQLQGEVTARNVLLREAKEQIEVVKVLLSRVAKLKPDSMCTLCDGFGSVTTWCHDEPHADACVCTDVKRWGLG